MRYRHNKTGNHYWIMHEAQFKIPYVGWQNCIVYKDNQGEVFVRLRAEFFEKFTLEN